MKILSMDFAKKIVFYLYLSNNLNFRLFSLYFQIPHKPSKYKHSHHFHISKNLPYLPIINKIQPHFLTKLASKEKMILAYIPLLTAIIKRKKLFFLRLHPLHIHVQPLFLS